MALPNSTKKGETDIDNQRMTGVTAEKFMERTLQKPETLPADELCDYVAGGHGKGQL